MTDPAAACPFLAAQAAPQGPAVPAPAPAPEPRRTLPRMPRNIARLPLHRGYPVPYFVAIIDGQPDFRIMDPEKQLKAVRGHRCLICGKPLKPGAPFAFNIGPMCAVNRISAEAPAHVECADWSARACPFLARPGMTRREHDYPENATDPAGIMLRHNPGVALVWITSTYEVMHSPQGDLFSIGRPSSVRAYREGRPATPAEVTAAVAQGFPALAHAATQDGPEHARNLLRMLGNAAVALRLDSERLTAAAFAALYPESAPLAAVAARIGATP